MRTTPLMRSCVDHTVLPANTQHLPLPWGGADLRFNSPQSDTSRSCKSTDTGLVCRVGCLFSSQLAPVPIYCLVNRGTCVEREAPRPGIEHATSRLQVRLPNHYSTTPHIASIAPRKLHIQINHSNRAIFDKVMLGTKRVSFF